MNTNSAETSRWLSGVDVLLLLHVSSLHKKLLPEFVLDLIVPTVSAAMLGSPTPTDSSHTIIITPSYPLTLIDAHGDAHHHDIIVVYISIIAVHREQELL